MAIQVVDDGNGNIRHVSSAPTQIMSSGTSKMALNGTHPQGGVPTSTGGATAQIKGPTQQPVTQSQTGTLNANITSPSTTKMSPAPTVITSGAAEADLSAKKAQFDQLQQDTAAHQAAITQPPAQPLASKTDTATQQPATPSLDDQISQLIGNLGTSTKQIQSDTAATLTPIQQQQQEAQTTLDIASAKAIKQLNQIASGTYPLSGAERSLLDSTTQQFQATIAAQQTANDAYTGQMTELMASLGINTSAPTQAIGMIHAAVSAGTSKIADLNSQMATSIANLQIGFQKQDYSMISDAWDATSKALNDRVQTLQDLQKSVTDAAKQQQQDLKDNTTLALTGIMDSNTISYQQKELALSQAQLDETTRHNFATELANDPSSPQAQSKLFNQGVSTLKAELSNRSGGLGLQDAKVNQAIHLKNLFDQYKTTVQVADSGAYGPATGATHEETVYNIPPAVYTELAIGVANLVSGSNNVAEGTINNIKQATARGDIGKALTYATGQPFNGSSQAILSQLKDSVDRQATTAEDLRDTYKNDLLLRLPPGLSPENTARLTQSAGLNSYYSPKEQVDKLIQENPADAEPAAKLSEAGWSDQDIADYLNQSQ